MKACQLARVDRHPTASKDIQSLLGTRVAIIRKRIKWKIITFNFKLFHDSAEHYTKTKSPFINYFKTA